MVFLAHISDLEFPAGNSGAGNLGNSHWEFDLQMSPIPGIPGIRNIVHACAYIRL